MYAVFVCATDNHCDSGMFVLTDRFRSSPDDDRKTVKNVSDAS